MLIFLVIPILFVLFQNLSSEKNILLNILKSILTFCFITFSITEFLSLINQLNLYGLIISWFFIFIVLLFLLFKTKSKLVKSNLLKKTNAFSIYEKIYLTIIGLLILLLFYQGIIYPPNNWDSLTYHMSRIMYWLGNENLNHFPTHILRHLYQPPFAEYIIMHVNVLQGNDYFSNSIQLLFLFFTLISLNEILKWFEVKRINRLTALLFCITIPSVILQSTTTKNDIVCAFFVITAMLFLIKCYEKPDKINFIYLGISIGLGMLTKGTFYIFIFPALVFFIILFVIKILKQKTYRKIFLGFISVFFIFIINVGHFSRNYKVNQHILNIDDTEHKMYSNEDMNVKFFMSNLLKNIGLHMGKPVKDNFSEFIFKFHDYYNIDIDNTKLNFNNTKYSAPLDFETHEDLVPNTFHFVLLLSVCLFLLFNSIYKKNYKILLLLFILSLQIILFTIYLKWQPWHTRLHIPIFILSSVFIGIFFNLFKKPIYLLPLIPILIFNFYFYFIYNSLRPIITNLEYTKAINIKDERLLKYFSNQLSLFEDYNEIINLINKDNPKKVGLTLTDWEYPLFNSYYYEKISLRSINVNNITKKIPQDVSNLDVLILNLNVPEYIFEGKKYKNMTVSNKYIWYYSK